MKNIYYHPESHGLEVVATLDKPIDWEFDMYVVWRRLSDGQLLYAQDSGCSCPSPFEDETLEELSPLGRGNFDLFKEKVLEWSKGYVTCPPAEVSDFFNQVKEAFKK